MMRSEDDTDQGADLNAGSDFPLQCSICLELVEIDGSRSKAKLQCGHEFHLDCIGSAFNVKGIMQCPNCRNIEKGQWLYANGSANLASDFSSDSWMAEQYPYFLVPYGFRICPFRGLMEMDDPSIAGHAFYGHHVNVHYQTWGHHSTPSSRTGIHMIESNHPFPSSQRPSIGTGSSTAPMAAHQNPNSGLNAFGGIQVPHPFNRHPYPAGMPLPYPPGVRRSSGFRGFPALLPAAQPYDPRARFYYPPYLSTGYNLPAAENIMANYSQAWGRGIHYPMLHMAHDSDRWLRHQ